MKQKQIRQITLCAALLLLCTLLLCGCNNIERKPIHEGETYLEGSWCHTDNGLNIGYNLFADGSGFQFIGNTVNPIRYGIYEGNIYISVIGSDVVQFAFSKSDTGISIGGLLFEPVEENQAVAESIAAAISAAESNTEAGTPLAEQIGSFVSAMAGLLIVILLMVWVVRTIKKRRNQL